MTRQIIRRGYQIVLIGTSIVLSLLFVAYAVHHLPHQIDMVRYMFRPATAAPPPTYVLPAGETHALIGVAICIAGWAAYPTVLAMTAPVRPRILLLRRFHSEIGRNPVSTIFDDLTRRGYDCVTLADSIVSVDRSTLRGGLTTVAVAVWFVGFVSILGIPSIVLVLLLQWEFGVAPNHALAAGLLLILAAFNWMPKSVMNGHERFADWLVRRLTPRRPAAQWRQSDGSMQFPARFRRPWQSGLTVLETTDDDWQEVVWRLVHSSAWICFDLHDPSTNMHHEMTVLAQQDMERGVVWMEPVSGQHIDIGDGWFEILGRRVRGAPWIWQYPDEGPGRDDIAYRSEMLDAFEDLLREIPESLRHPIPFGAVRIRAI
jgi:hypothetical protein